MSLIDDLKNTWSSILGPNPDAEDVEVEEELETDSPVDTSKAIREDDIYTSYDGSPASGIIKDKLTKVGSLDGTEEEVETNPFEGGFYEQSYDRLNHDIIPETREEMEKRERRERSRNTIFNLADGFAHIFNIWGASGGAQAMDISSMSDAHRKRMDIAREVRDRNKDAYTRGKFQALSMDRQDLMKQKAQEQAERAEKIKFDYKKEQDAINLRIKLEDQATKEASAKSLIAARESGIELKEKEFDLKKDKNKAEINRINQQAKTYEAKLPSGKKANVKMKSYYYEIDATVGGGKAKVPLAIEVADAHKEDYTSLVFNEMVRLAKIKDDERKTALREGEITNSERIRNEFDKASQGLESTTSVKESMVRSYAAEMGLGDFMVETANRINTTYFGTLDNPDRQEGVNAQPIKIPMEETTVDPLVSMGGVQKKLTDKEAQDLIDLGITIVE